MSHEIDSAFINALRTIGIELTGMKLGEGGFGIITEGKVFGITRAVKIAKEPVLAGTEVEEERNRELKALSLRCGLCFWVESSLRLDNGVSEMKTSASVDAPRMCSWSWYFQRSYGGKSLRISGIRPSRLSTPHATFALQAER